MEAAMHLRVPGPPGLRPALFLLVGLLPVTLSGCAATGASSHGQHGDSTLSEASGEAAKEESEQKKLRVRHDRQEPEEEEAEPVETEESAAAGSTAGEGADADWTPSHWHAGVVAGGASYGGGAFRSQSGFGVRGGVTVDPHLQLDGAGLYREYKLRDSADLQGLFRPSELLLDFSARAYLTEEHTFVGLYGLAGMQAGYTFWKYRNPIEAVEHHWSRTVRSDGITGYAFYAGAGIAPIQSRTVHLGVSLTGGVQWFGSESSQGFDNDLLPAQGYVQLMIELSRVGSEGKK
jgi:hypothetical protein